jgi:CheY-specific phosphatase CheX
MSMPQQPPPEKPWSPDAHEPSELIHWSSQALERVLDSMAGVQLKGDRTTRLPEGEDTAVAGCITMTTTTGSWNLAVSGTRASSEKIARLLMEIPDGEEVTPDIVSDTMGELVNLMAGALKTAQGASAVGWRLGLPMYLEGSSWFRRAPRDTKFVAERLEGGGLSLQVVLCWRVGRQSLDSAP